MSDKLHNLCNCPNCATDDCPAAREHARVCLALAEAQAKLSAAVARIVDVEDNFAHAPDCAIALNARHDCSCRKNPSRLGAAHLVRGTQHGVVGGTNQEEVK